MKKVVSLLLALIMALSLVACGEKKGETDDNTVPYLSLIHISEPTRP